MARARAVALLRSPIGKNLWRRKPVAAIDNIRGLYRVRTQMGPLCIPSGRFGGGLLSGVRWANEGVASERNGAPAV